MDESKGYSTIAIEPGEEQFKDQAEIPIHDDNAINSNTDIENSDKLAVNWISENKRKRASSYDHSVRVLDVASYILNKKGPMTTMKLQKLVYYCQAWSLVWDEKPMFKEEIEAWANGPVVRELFNYHRGQYMISSVLTGNPDLLNKEQIETIDAVLDFYGNKSSQWLSDLTHFEDPWRLTRMGMPESQRGNRIISFEKLANYYGSLPPNKE